jgi:hypothetical protein
MSYEKDQTPICVLATVTDFSRPLLSLTCFNWEGTRLMEYQYIKRLQLHCNSWEVYCIHCLREIRYSNLGVWRPEVRYVIPESVKGTYQTMGSQITWEWHTVGRCRMDTCLHSSSQEGLSCCTNIRTMQPSNISDNTMNNDLQEAQHLWGLGTVS